MSNIFLCRQGNLPNLMAGIFMPAHELLYGRFRTPIRSVNAPLNLPASMLDNGTGETALFLALHLLSH